MDEGELIRRTERPATVASLEEDLRRLGVREGDVLVVHTSLSALGWVAGGAAAVVDALVRAVGPEGTVTMPSHSGQWSDPALWQNPPVPPDWCDTIAQGRPGYDPYATPMREMGAVAENLLMRRATLRSAHPLHSHMALGAHAERIIADHRLEDGFGDRSPLGRLYELDAKVLLLGVGHGNNTSLHLAESRATWPGKAPIEYRSTLLVDGRPRVVGWTAQPPDADDFAALGEVLDASGLVRMGRVGQGECRFVPQRALVDAAVPWFEAHRPVSS